MGQMHIWYRSTGLTACAFKAAVEDVRRAFKWLDVPLAGRRGTGSPVLKDNAVVFNSTGGSTKAAFELYHSAHDRSSEPEAFSSCTPLGRRYDLAVKVVLVILKHHLGEHLKIVSGESAEAWQEAREIVEAGLKYGATFRPDSDRAS